MSFDVFISFSLLSFSSCQCVKWSTCPLGLFQFLCDVSNFSATRLRKPRASFTSTLLNSLSLSLCQFLSVCLLLSLSICPSGDLQHVSPSTTARWKVSTCVSLASVYFHLCKTASPVLPGVSELYYDAFVYSSLVFSRYTPAHVEM